ncbi:MAG: penicillin-binding protein, partial [Acidobacteriaceae bacterium]|nr:penicillin-binding protein [Acidobacteriaceae bacterium]
MNLQKCIRFGVCLAAMSVLAVAQSTPAANTSTKKHHHKRHSHPHVVSVSETVTQAAVLRTDRPSQAKVAIARRRRGKRVFFNPWTEPTYGDSTIGDNIEGEDAMVRKAAVDALGPYNGAVVVSDPNSGRILSIVNQKLALKGAFQPCSTVKVMVSLASLSEGLVNSETPVRLTRRFSMNMTRALATSNNMYFAHLGQELGFDRVVKYGKLFGMGEKAGLDIAGEEPGYLASEPPNSGVGMMTSFG